MRRSIAHIVGFAVLATATLTAACGSGGEGNVLAVTATGRVAGVVYFDGNGTGVPDGTDQGIPNLEVRVVLYGTIDTVARPITQPDGSFQTTTVPVGRYQVVIADEILGDTIAVVQLDDSVVSVKPDSTALVTVGIAYPRVSTAEARQLPVGAKVFLEGLALSDFDVFGDTTTHIADTAGAMRATRVRRTLQLLGDSVRLQGTMAVRDGQPVIDDPVLFVLAQGRPLPPPEIVGTGAAAAADGGRADAALVRLSGVTIADTATTAAGFELHADDGTGRVTILLDQDISFTLAGLVPSAQIDATGVLVPDGSGSWRLKPRRNADVVIR